VRDLRIALDDPLTADVVELLERHLALMHAATPICEVYALGPHALTSPEITFFSARRGGELVAVGALKEIDPEHGELKSMHTAGAPSRWRTRWTGPARRGERRSPCGTPVTSRPASASGWLAARTPPRAR
jgi:hypothetical protein